MSKSRKFLFWTICYMLSFLSLITVFPILLFAFYPYTVLAVAMYVVMVVVFSVLSFRKSAIKRNIIKRILFGALLVPIIVLITALVSIELGWLRYPG